MCSSCINRNKKQAENKYCEEGDMGALGFSCPVEASSLFITPPTSVVQLRTHIPPVGKKIVQ